MYKIFVSVALLAVLAVPVNAQDKAKNWCTDAHMKQMDAQLAKMTDTQKRQAAADHLAQSKAAMQAKDDAGCVRHMEAAHKAMGM